MNTDRYYERLRTATTLAELKSVYQDFQQAFCNDEITIEQYHSLRMAFHNAKILRAVD